MLADDLDVWRNGDSARDEVHSIVNVENLVSAHRGHGLLERGGVVSAAIASGTERANADKAAGRHVLVLRLGLCVPPSIAVEQGAALGRSCHSLLDTRGCCPRVRLALAPSCNESVTSQNLTVVGIGNGDGSVGKVNIVDKQCSGRDGRGAAGVGSLDADRCVVDGRVDKRDKYREKNRVAAAKCRAKKKEHIDGLEESHRTQSMLNALLKQTAQTLRDELSFWRTQALQHGYCDCKAIQEYNMRKARALAADGEFGQTEAALDQLDSAPFSGSEDVDVNLIA